MKVFRSPAVCWAGRLLKEVGTQRLGGPVSAVVKAGYPAQPATAGSALVADGAGGLSGVTGAHSGDTVSRGCSPLQPAS